MPANIGETEVLNYLVTTGPISLADLAFRFDDPYRVLRALNNLEERGEIDIIDVSEKKTGVLDRIIGEVSRLAPSTMTEESYNLLRDSPDSKLVVRLTRKGLRNVVA
jgi:hypothetical protein